MITKYEAFWIQMWIDKQALKWNPWVTDRYEKKRPCQIAGMRKMNEFHLTKMQQDHEKQKQKNQQSSSLSNNTMSPSKLGKGTHSREYVKLNYKDPDMNRLMNERKGTTSKYNYQ